MKINFEYFQFIDPENLIFQKVVEFGHLKQSKLDLHQNYDINQIDPIDHINQIDQIDRAN